MYPCPEHLWIKTPNSNGLALVDICRNNNLFILNGRMGTDKDTGQFTYRNSSVIDYAIATAECFVFLTEFGIIETDSLFSDGHAIIKFTVSSKIKVTPPHKQKLHKDNTSAKWKQNLASSFINNINEENIDHIKYLCDVCPCAPSSIDEITNTITVMFQNAAAETFPKQCSYNHAFKRPWFGIKCKQAQTCYYEAKNIYKCERSLSNKTLLQNASKNYKRTMNYFNNQYKFKNAQTLRTMHSKSSKEYWKYIHRIGAKKSKKSPSLDSLYNHFKNINCNDITESNEFNLDTSEPVNRSRTTRWN